MSVIEEKVITDSIGITVLEPIVGFRAGGQDASVGQPSAIRMELEDAGVSQFFDESMATGGGGLDYDQFTDNNNNNFDGFINFDMGGTSDGLLFP